MGQCQVPADLVRLLHSDQRNIGVVHPQNPILREVVAMGAQRPVDVGRAQRRWAVGLMEAALRAGEPISVHNLSPSRGLV